MATQQFKYGGDFTGNVSFDVPVKYVRQPSYSGTGFSEPYISAISDGFAFGVTNGSGEVRAFAFRGVDLTEDTTTTLFIKAGGTLITSSNFSEQLKLLSGYNETVPQVLSHDTSGNIQWVEPA